MRPDEIPNLWMRVTRYLRIRISSFETIGIAFRIQIAWCVVRARVTANVNNLFERKYLHGQQVVSRTDRCAIRIKDFDNLDRETYALPHSRLRPYACRWPIFRRHIVSPRLPITTGLPVKSWSLHARNPIFTKHVGAACTRPGLVDRGYDNAVIPAALCQRAHDTIFLKPLLRFAVAPFNGRTLSFFYIFLRNEVPCSQ